MLFFMLKNHVIFDVFFILQRILKFLDEKISITLANINCTDIRGSLRSMATGLCKIRKLDGRFVYESPKNGNHPAYIDIYHFRNREYWES